MRGIDYWLLTVPIPGLQRTLDERYCHPLFKYRFYVQMWPEKAKCLSCTALMDIFEDHALLCHENPADFEHAPSARRRVPSCVTPSPQFIGR